MKVQESLKILRKELGLTQTELALALKVNSMSVSRWENGKTVPQAKTIKAILNLAKCRGASEHCVLMLQEALQKGHEEVVRVPKSKLYPIARESICDLVDGSHNAIYVSDLESDEIFYANERAEAFAGRPHIQGEKCYHFLYGRNEPCLQCPKGQMMEDESTNFHITSPKDGRHFLFRGRKLMWNGRPAHAQYFFEEKTVLEEEDGFRKLVDLLDIGICTFWIYDDGKIQMCYLNDGYFAIVDSTREKREQYGGFGVMNAVIEDDKQQVYEIASSASKKCQSFQMTYRVYKDDRSPKRLYISAKFIRREKGKSLYYSIIEDLEGNRSRKQLGGTCDGIS